MLASGALSGTPCPISLHLLNVYRVRNHPRALGSELPPKAEEACPGVPGALQNPDSPWPLLSELKDVKVTVGPTVLRVVLSFWVGMMPGAKNAKENEVLVHPGAGPERAAGQSVRPDT